MELVSYYPIVKDTVVITTKAHPKYIVTKTELHSGCLFVPGQVSETTYCNVIRFEFLSIKELTKSP